MNLLDYTLFDSLTFRGTAFTDSLPFFTPFQLQIAPTNDPFNPIVTFDSLVIDNENPNAFLFLGVDDTTLYIPNPDGRSIKFSMVTKELKYYNTSANNSIQNDVELVLVNAVTDAPAIDIEAQGVGTLIGNLIYGETADSIGMASAPYTFDVKRSSNGQLLGSFPVDLSGYGDQTVIVAVSGFLDPASNQNGPPMDITIHETQVSAPPVGITDQGDFTKLESFQLFQNYPNPFNPTTTIEFALPHPEFTTLKIYNILGEEVTTLVSEKLVAGKHKYEWDVIGLASGVYLYRIQAGDYVESKKMVLLQ
jgi:hypothetical protein